MTITSIACVFAGIALLGCGIDDEDFDSAEQAASVHLKGGKSAEPSFRDNGLTLSSTASLSGLGGGDVTITLAARGIPDSRCTNPAGATQPPGQNPAFVDITGSLLVPQDQIKNGNLTFTVFTDAPASPIPGAPDCPNSGWTQTIIDMAFTEASITVEQPAPTSVFTADCTFSPATYNGAVPAGQVSCTL